MNAADWPIGTAVVVMVPLTGRVFPGFHGRRGKVLEVCLTSELLGVELVEGPWDGGFYYVYAEHVRKVGAA